MGVLVVDPSLAKLMDLLRQIQEVEKRRSFSWQHPTSVFFVVNPCTSTKWLLSFTKPLVEQRGQSLL